MRRFLRSLAGVWIACQLLAAASPLTLFSDDFGIDQAACCPGVGPGQMCPMHHKSAGDPSTCRMESACAHHDTALLAIMATGALPPAAVVVTASSDTAPIVATSVSTRSRAASPDLPPPRPLA
jgi:hypothetical protein